LLVLIILVVFWQGVKNDFTHFDDNQYVTENEHVQAGLTWKNLLWAFTTTHSVNWHPLTWLSHMLDCQLYGLNPAGHHLTNVFGVALARQGRLEEAIVHFKTALQLQPDNGNARANLDHAIDLVGKTTKK
jgi:tetratricopeptide (TPR) repeat protein